MKMEAPKQFDFGNGDREFPEGLYLEFYEDGVQTSSLRADYCYYTAKDDLYKATGNVVIERVDNKDRLDTEELYWNQRKEDVFTDKYVIIQQGGETHGRSRFRSQAGLLLLQNTGNRRELYS